MPLLPMLTPLRRGHRLALLAGAVLCTAAALLGQFRFGNSLYLYTDLKDKPGAFQGSMTVVSAFLLVIAAVLMFRSNEALRRRGERRAAGGFAGLAGMSMWLAYDELAMFHEWATVKLQQHAVPKLFGIDQDLYVFLAYGAALLPLAALAAPVALRHRAALTVLALAVAFAVGSEAADFVPWHRLDDAARTWLGPIEEGLKTMATLAGTLYAHALLDAIEAEAAPAPSAAAAPR